MKKRIVILLILVFVVIVGVLLATGCQDKKEETGEISAVYDIFCALDDENKVLYVTTNITLENEGEVAVCALPLYLYANAYGKGDNVEVGNVKVDNHEVDFSIDGINMLVNLETPLEGGESTTLITSCRVSVLEGEGRLGYGEGYYNLHAFFPRLAYYDGEKFEIVPYYKTGDPFLFSMDDFNIRMEYPLGYTLGHSGRLISEEVGELTKMSQISISDARDVAFSLAKDFTCHEDEVSGIKIKEYTRGEDNHVEFIGKCLTYFQEEVGDYPYDTFTIAILPFEEGGMEYSSYVLVSEQFKDKEYAIAHEIIHQWFGLSIGSNGYTESWVDESLTNFLTYYYMDIYKGGTYEDSIKREKEVMNKFIESMKKEYGDSYKPELRQSLNEFRGRVEYACVVYGYGVITYDGIMKSVGEKKFKKALEKYYKEYSGKVVSEEKLIESFSSTLGKGVGKLFKSYLECKVVF